MTLKQNGTKIKWLQDKMTLRRNESRQNNSRIRLKQNDSGQND